MTDAHLHPPRRRRLALQAGLALAAGALGLGTTGCSSLLEQQTLSWSETELALMMGRQFPLQKRLLEVVEVELSNPQVRLLPERSRIATGFDLQASDRLFGHRATGHVDLDYRIRFEPSDHSLRLQDVRVQRLDLAADANPLRGQAQRLGVLAAEQLLEGLSVYKMRPEQADRMDRLNLEVRSVGISARGLEVLIASRGR